MQIKTIKLSNFMCFTEHMVELASRFNLIVGNNGTGKTSILNGLSIALGATFRPIPLRMLDSTIRFDQVHRKFYTKGDTATSEPQFPSRVECSGMMAGEECSWGAVLNRDGLIVPSDGNALPLLGKVMAVADRIAKGEDLLLHVVANYGTGRLWMQLSETGVETLSPDTRTQGYADCLNPASHEKRLLEWFKTNELIALQKNTRIGVLEACRKAICACVPGASHVYFDISLDQLVLEIDGKRLPFVYLSDGYRNMLAMAADIAVRCATLNPHFRENAATETPGVVLIDEIDLHLHPKWQRSVITDLMKAFPKVQFVATTHSPFVIQSLPASADVQLINLDDPAETDVQNKSIEDISEWIQGVDLPQRSQRYVQMMDKASQYFGMLKDESASTDDQRQSARRELEQVVMPFSDNPGYHAFIKMQEIASKKTQNIAGTVTFEGRRLRAIDMSDNDDAPKTKETGGSTREGDIP